MKKALSILCILAMLFSLAAFAQAEENDVVTLKVFYSAPDETPNWKWGMDPISTWITEKTGVALDITYASTSDHQEFYSLLASDMIKDYDLLYLGKYEPKLVEDGYVLALDELAEKYCPQWFDVISEEERAIHSIDGHVYYTTYNFADAKREADLPGAHKAFSMFYNYQAMDKLGVDPATIKTLDDVETIAKRLRDELGINYPIYLNSYGVTSTIDYAQILSASSFGAPGVVYPQADGTVTYNVKSDEYKAALEWLNKMYKEGLIKAENFTFTNSLNDENVKNIAQKGDLGFVLGHMWQIHQHRPEQNGGTASGGELSLLQFAGQAPLAEGVKEEDIRVSDQNLSQIGSPAYYVLDRTQHPEECIKFITFLFTDECLLIYNYGVEGEGAYTWQYDPGAEREWYVATDEYKASLTELSAEEQRIKWGIGLAWLSTFRTNYALSDGIPLKIYEEDGVRKQAGEMLIYIGGLYGSPFKTGGIVLNFTDPDDLLLRQNVEEAWKNNEALCVLADDFEAAYAKMLSDMETVGLKDLEQKLTQRYWDTYDMLHEERNLPWDEAAAR